MFQYQGTPAVTNQSLAEISPSLDSENLLGVKFVNSHVATTLDWLCTRLELRQPARIAFYNAHCANVSARDEAYAHALNTADAVLPDGSGIALGLKLRGRQLIANLNGTDLIPALCRRLAATGHSVFLLGGQPGVAQAAAAGLQKAAPGLIIAGTHDGFFEANEEAALIRSINNSGADVVLVAMGVPKQDIWLQRVAPRLRATLTFGVGGLFDFLSHRIPRAPAILRKTGMEWSFRLYQEPRRMFRRYIIGNPEFVGRVLADAIPSRAACMTALDEAGKRIVDVCGAGGGLLFLLPLFLLVSLAIRATSPGPALLRQTRVGENGKLFTLYKFRSMYRDADARRAALLATNQHGADGVTFKMKQDPRITPVGRLLRKSSIDELPQLINVLNGTMSLVGPRPALPSEVERYNEYQRGRLAGKPGLTGLWQVSGRADLPFPRQVELDIDYLTTRTLAMDIMLLLRTVPAVLFARGAY